ncbi:EndoU domain-containing protein [Salmonella enterica subsp. enterica serovar Kentucky]|nr:EndoU domain-containing protein [Salmonella enterica]EKL0880679.1 EndoU domain-containing protein [Salmonella enterica subsp. enterica serovar Kentucky]
MSTEVDKMRFNTIIDAHSFMKNYRSGEEQGKGTPVGDALYPVASYGDGRYVSRICFKYLGATGDYDPTTCTGDPATVYWRSTYVLPGEMDKTPFLDRDLGLPTTTMCVGNPIHLGTGNKFQAELDYQSGGSDPFTFTRYYNSHLPDEELGGWRHTYSRSVEVNASKYGENMVVLHRPEGQQLAFYNSSSVWVPTWKTDDTLTKDATGWRYTQSDGVVEAYDETGRLTGIEKPNGNHITLSYLNGELSSITDGFGRNIQFQHQDGRMVSVTDPAGGSIQYQYNSAGKLAEVIYQDNTSRSYLYDDPNAPGLLSGLVDENGNRFATWGYDAQGMAVLSEHAGGAEKTQVSYNADGSVSVTNALGHVQRYTYSRHNGMLKPDVVEGAPCTGFVGGKETYVYDSKGLVSSITDRAGQKRTFTHNDRGLETTQIDQDGGKVTTDWLPSKSLPAKITEPTRITELTYDTHLRVISRKVTDRSSGASRTWTYTYAPVGTGKPSLLASVDGPRTDVSDVTTFDYDDQGNLIRTTNALGQVMQFGDYDANGRAGTIQGVNGVTQTLTYDARGRLVSSTGPEGTTAYNYDAVGLLSSLTKPNGATVSYEYDAAHRLVAATVAGVTAAYTYNHLDQRVTKTLNGQTRLLIYGLAGNLIEELDAATGDVLAEYIWLDGTPLSFAQSGQTYQVHVDHLGTPKALTDASGQVVWKASYSPFGKASITTQGPTFNLRFPGQYYDAETGLHYNWRRYYDPNTGRYITSDPIGLAGGINTYAYALSNPIGNADPTGEFVPLLLGAYVAIDFALSAWDAYDTFKTITSDCATSREKWISGGLFAAGIILPGNYKALGNVAERAFKNTADDFVDLASSQRRKHILDGDATGGGHRAGTGKPGKSEFPQSWSDEKIMHVISDIATDPNVSRKAGRGGRTIAEAVKEGINVRVIQESNGDIVSGFPTNVPRNPK